MLVELDNLALEMELQWPPSGIHVNGTVRIESLLLSKTDGQFKGNEWARRRLPNAVCMNAKQLAYMDTNLD